MILPQGIPKGITAEIGFCHRQGIATPTRPAALRFLIDNNNLVSPAAARLRGIGRLWQSR